MWSLREWWYRCLQMRKTRRDTATELEWLLEDAQTWHKPRGLSWVSITAIGPEIFVRDQKWTWIRLVPIEVQFAPILGSDMEDVPAAHDARQGTATFHYECASGVPTCGVLFNLTPEQAIERSGGKWIVVT